MFVRPPEQLLVQIGSAHLKDLVDVIGEQVIADCVKIPFRDFPGVNREELAVWLGTSRATASRLFNGDSRVARMSVRSLCHYLRCVNSSLYEVVPDPATIERREVHVVVTEFWQRRHAAGELPGDQPPGDEDIRAILDIADRFTITHATVFSDAVEWREWCASTAQACSNLSHTVLAADWLCAERYLPHFLVRLVRTLKRVTGRTNGTSNAALKQLAIELIGLVLLTKQVHSYIRDGLSRGLTDDGLVEFVAQSIPTTRSRFPEYLTLVKLSLEDFLQPEAEIGVLVLKSHAIAPLLRAILRAAADGHATAH